MFYGYGRGNRPAGGMGMGFRGASPPWPYVGRGRGGLPRCGYYAGGTAAPVFTAAGKTGVGGNRPYAATMSKEEELNYLKNQAQAIKEQMDSIETRMRDLQDKD